MRYERGLLGRGGAERGERERAGEGEPSTDIGDVDSFLLEGEEEKGEIELALPEGGGGVGGAGQPGGRRNLSLLFKETRGRERERRKGTLRWIRITNFEMEIMERTSEDHIAPSSSFLTCVRRRRRRRRRNDRNPLPFEKWTCSSRKNLENEKNALASICRLQREVK